ncbi:hypothetical protein AB9F26_09665 [Falsihalocynthiibacter sp. BN13B15]|uniref:winged helix domain-containing protein n=1 Tax=Falsihalocynthiibacter sp. BN13B15 TaxID=3240871 RepID=UPI00350FA633
MRIKVTLNLSEQSRTFELKGRLGWTMVHLVRAGAKGLTTLEHPALRMSAYIFSLREMGIPIETQMVPHKGSYPGMHALYVLSCDAHMQLLEAEVQA